MKHRTAASERAVMKKLAVNILLLLMVAALVSMAFYIVSGYEYIKEIPLDSVARQWSASSFSIAAQNPPTARVQQVLMTDEGLQITFLPISRGQTDFELRHPELGYLTTIQLYVSPVRQIFDINNGNFSNWRFYSWMITIVLLGSAVLMLWAFIRVRRQRMYSYLCIFWAGFAVWIMAIALYRGILTVLKSDLFTVITTLSHSGWWFMILSLPFCVIFAAALTASNISLIRHEGHGKKNLLGFGLSAALLMGQVLIILNMDAGFIGSQLTLRLLDAYESIWTSLYVLMECFLIGAIICGALAARHEPTCEADYIIILGCAIRKDGTLFPLLRGRVDRALTFAEKQFERTGKAAVFVPSGGQGRNEVISQAEAMQRYLLAKGIPSERIMIENKSVNTAENMRFSRELIQQRDSDAKVVFSTTNYHVFRSGIISRQAGFTPEGIGSTTKWYYWPNAAVRELIGMISYLRKILLLLLLVIIVFSVALIMLMPI